MFLLLSIYSSIHSVDYDPPPYVNIHALTYNPAAYEGERLWFHGLVQGLNHSQDGVVLLFKTKYGEIQVIASDTRDLPGINRPVAVRGVMKSGKIYAEEIKIIKFRKFRYAVSIVVLIAIIYLFLREYRLSNYKVSK